MSSPSSATLLSRRVAAATALAGRGDRHVPYGAAAGSMQSNELCRLGYWPGGRLLTIYDGSGASATEPPFGDGNLNHPREPSSGDKVVPELVNTADAGESNQRAGQQSLRRDRQS